MAAFEALLYTDCVPGQGLAGTAGLQFQARSAGADRAAQQVVQRSLLYEPPDAWMRERRPVPDYPPSFAHVHDELYATGAGVYLGKEANGGREGNQLTHSIVTRDPADYGLLRPAQLFGAPWWTRTPAPSTTCAPPEVLEPGPFDVDAARDLVLADPRGRARLVALVSAFDRIGGPDERRVLFVAEDAAAVLAWIAAASMLLPQRRALEIGFKVFTLRPAYAPQPVVAVHPAWGSSSVSVANDSGYAVFDLVDGDFTDVPPTDEAARRVDLLRNEDYDPYDVLDVIEYASWIGLSPRENVDLAVAVRWPGPMPADLARLAVRWLRDSDPDLLPDCRRALVDQLCDRIGHWDRDLLVDLDALAVAGQVPADRIAAVRLALIGAELDRVTHDPGSAAGPLPALPAGVWQPAQVLETEELVARALADSGRNSAFDALLRLAKQLDVVVRLERLGPVVDAFVEDWADHPEHPYRHAAWAQGDVLDLRLRRLLAERVDDGRAAEVGDAWWRRLEPRTERLHSDLDRAVVAAAMAHGSEALRLDLVRRFAPGGVDVLWSRTGPTDDELRELLPIGSLLPGHLFDEFRRRLLNRAVPLTREAVDLARDLADHGLYQPSTAVREVVLGDEQLARICHDLPRRPDAGVFMTYPPLLHDIDERLKDLWAGPLADAMLQAGEPRWAEMLVQELSRQGYVTLVRKLVASLGSTTPYRHLLIGFYLAHSRFVGPGNRRALRAAAVVAIGRSGDKRLKPIAEAVGKLGGKYPLWWDEAVADARKPSILSRFRGGGT